MIDWLDLASKRIPVPSVAGLISSSSCRTLVPSSLGVDGTWFTVDSDHSFSLPC